LPLSTFNCARLVIDGYQIVQDASGPANPATPIAISAGTFGDVAIRNCAMDLHGTSSTNFCAVSGGTIASLTFKGCEFNYANSVLTYTAGTISQLGSTGLTHRNAGAAAYVLTNSTAIPRMVASGTDATTLYSGTAPTILQAGSP
jgi:hypothetical protein